ncbi:MAG TPA: beta-glucosidase [Microvirga sp.]|nr:beta-glucosidase [Microvirga sp.]
MAGQSAADEENDRAVEVSAVVGGERARENERHLHEVIKAHAARLPPPDLSRRSPGLFQSFFIGGFEGATHRRRDGRRLDLIAATGHDVNAAADYRMLARHGIQTVRDGLRWHLIETSPGHYDWSSFLPMLWAARDTGTQVIWDICHWGWPDDLDIWSPAFIDRFARFAAAAARLVKDETDAVPFYVPVNEISFWSWAGGSLGYISPLARGRGKELKGIIVRAAIAAIEAVRAVEPRARIVSAEPTIHVIPRSDDPQGHAARDYTLAQFEALDFLSGRHRPELGGRPDYIDIIGVNFYLHNQWVDGGLPVSLDHPQYRPLRQLLADIHHRYRRPLFVAETGIEGDTRAAWLRVVGCEVGSARQAGVPVEGICLYPITDYPGWVDERHCPTGLLGYVQPDGTRPAYEPLAIELAVQQRRAAEEGSGTGARRAKKTFVR